MNAGTDGTFPRAGNVENVPSVPAFMCPPRLCQVLIQKCTGFCQSLAGASPKWRVSAWSGLQTTAFPSRRSSCSYGWPGPACLEHHAGRDSPCTVEVATRRPVIWRSNDQSKRHGQRPPFTLPHPLRDTAATPCSTPWLIQAWPASATTPQSGLTCQPHSGR